MLRIVTGILMFLMLSGCAPTTTTRYVAMMPVDKQPFGAGRFNWCVLMRDGAGNEYTIDMYYDEAIRIVPGVPVSVCETLDSNGVVIDRQLARRVD